MHDTSLQLAGTWNESISFHMASCAIHPRTVTGLQPLQASRVGILEVTHGDVDRLRREIRRVTCAITHIGQVGRRPSFLRLPLKHSLAGPRTTATGHLMREPCSFHRGWDDCEVSTLPVEYRRDPIGFVLSYLSSTGESALVSRSDSRIVRVHGVLKHTGDEVARAVASAAALNKPVVFVTDAVVIAQVGFTHWLFIEISAETSGAVRQLQRRAARGARAMCRLLRGHHVSAIPPRRPNSSGGSSAPMEALAFLPTRSSTSPS